MYMFHVLIVTHLYSNISQSSDIFVQNLFVDNYSYFQTTDKYFVNTDKYFVNTDNYLWKG